MEEQRPENPYSPPASELNVGLPVSAQGVELASRRKRMMAATFDGLIIAVPLVPALAVAIYEAVQTQAAVMKAGIEADASSMSRLGDNEALIVIIGAAAIGFLGALGIAIYQWLLISRTGQSLGKKWSRIRIERMDGSRVTFGTGVALRNWVPKVMGAVPYLGLVFYLIDSLYIFREDRRGLHDLIAGTRVVRHPR